MTDDRANSNFTDPPAPSYEDVISQCAAGSEAGVARIYRAEHRKMRRIAQHIVRDGAGAEDVIHDAFVQIIRDSKNFDPARGTARQWIYAIVRHTALKRLQRDRREPTVADEALFAMCGGDESATDAEGRMAEYASLYNCLEALDPRHRASLILGIIDGRTHMEIAEHLGVPCGTVKSWIRRELVALRDRLK